jgi:hypothetical protein
MLSVIVWLVSAVLMWAGITAGSAAEKVGAVFRAEQP